MICYRYKTFCQYYEGCKVASIRRRAFTDDVKDAANKWWVSGGGKDGEAPICLFSHIPDCFEEVYV